MGAKQAEQAVMRAVREMIRVNPDAARLSRPYAGAASREERHKRSSQAL